LPAMAMRMVERGDSGAMLWAAPILFTAANLFVAWLAVASVRLLLQQRFLPAMISRAAWLD
jgi:tellurite resistance protein